MVLRPQGCLRLRNVFGDVKRYKLFIPLFYLINMKRALQETLTMSRKRVKSAVELHERWEKIANISQQIAHITKKKQQIINRIGDINSIVRVPEGKNWILYVCTWWRMLCAYRDSDEKESRLRCFFGVLGCDVGSLEELYGVLHTMQQQQLQYQQQYITLLNNLNSVYNFS